MKNKIITSILGILSILGIALCVIAKRFQNKSISIIGGADGPTSIFIAGKVRSSVIANTVIAVISILIIAIIGIVFLIRRK